MKIINTSSAPSAIGPYSQGIITQNLIFTSGQIPLSKDGELIQGGIKEQTHQVIQNLSAVLESGGSSLDKVVKTTVFLANMDDFTILNEVYAQYFTTTKPARSTVAVKTLPKNVLVEIECIATIN